MAGLPVIRAIKEGRYEQTEKEVTNRVTECPCLLTLKGFPGCGTFHFNTGTVPGKLRCLVPLTINPALFAGQTNGHILSIAIPAQGCSEHSHTSTGMVHQPSSVYTTVNSPHDIASSCLPASKEVCNVWQMPSFVSSNESEIVFTNRRNHCFLVLTRLTLMTAHHVTESNCVPLPREASQYSGCDHGAWYKTDVASLPIVAVSLDTVWPKVNFLTSLRINFLFHKIIIATLRLVLEIEIKTANRNQAAPNINGSRV